MRKIAPIAEGAPEEALDRRIALGALHVRTPPAPGGRGVEEAGVRIPWDGRGVIAPSDFTADPRMEALAQVQTL